jgi:hypothetical protein
LVGFACLRLEGQFRFYTLDELLNFVVFTVRTSLLGLLVCHAEFATGRIRWLFAYTSSQKGESVPYHFGDLRVYVGCADAELHEIIIVGKAPCLPLLKSSGLGAHLDRAGTRPAGG